jgi:protein-disulfide isomerase
LLWSKHPGSGHGDHLTAEKLKGYAREVGGMNTSQFDSCVDSNKYAQAVLDDTEAGRAVGVNGTPTAFINGRVVNGAQPFSAFKTIIDEELAK